MRAEADGGNAARTTLPSSYVRIGLRGTAIPISMDLPCAVSRPSIKKSLLARLWPRGRDCPTGSRAPTIRDDGIRDTTTR
jgi:hypothetical protein